MTWARDLCEEAKREGATKGCNISIQRRSGEPEFGGRPYDEVTFNCETLLLLEHPTVWATVGRSAHTITSGMVMGEEREGPDWALIHVFKPTNVVDPNKVDPSRSHEIIKIPSDGRPFGKELEYPDDFAAIAANVPKVDGGKIAVFVDDEFQGLVPAKSNAWWSDFHGRTDSYEKAVKDLLGMEKGFWEKPAVQAGLGVTGAAIATGFVGRWLGWW